MSNAVESVTVFTCIERIAALFLNIFKKINVYLTKVDDFVQLLLEAV